MTAPGPQPRTRLATLLHARRAPALIIGLGVLVRLLYVLAFHPAPQSDFGWYFARAQGILAGQGFSVDGVPTAYWPVGYAAFLAGLFRLFGTSVAVGLAVNLVLHALILVLYYWLARAMLRSEAGSRLALLALALYPNHVAYCSLLASENLCLPLMLAGLAALVAYARDGRWPWLPLAGTTFGLATLTRAQFLFVPALVLLVLLGSRRQFVKAALAGLVLYAALLLTMSPWIARNYRVYGDFVLVSNNGGIVLMLGSNPQATGTYTGSGPVADILRADIDEHQRDARARAYAVQYMARHPARVVALWPRKLFYLYSSDIEGLRWSVVGLHLAPGLDAALRVFRRAHEGVYLLLMAAFVGSLFVFVRRRRDALFFLGAWLVAYSALMGILFFGDPRYHFQDVPWILLYPAALLASKLERPQALP